MLGVVKLPLYFSVRFEVKGLSLPSGPLANIIDIVGEDYLSILTVYITSDGYLTILYDGTIVTTDYLRIEINYETDWTAIAIAVTTAGLTLESSVTGAIDIPDIPVVDTSAHLYQVYTSNRNDVSAYGDIQLFTIEGTYLLF